MIELARTPRAKQQLQVNRLKRFKKKNAEKAQKALEKLADVVESGENTFPALLEAAEVCSLRPNHRLPAGDWSVVSGRWCSARNVGGAFEPRLVAACQTIPRTCAFTG